MDVERVIARAASIQQKANEALSCAERKEQIKYSEMIKHPEDKIYLMRLLDESTQNSNNLKLIRRIQYLNRKYGTLHFLSWWERCLFKLFIWFGWLVPPISVPCFLLYLRSTTAKVIINEAPTRLHKHLQERREQRIGQNVNLIGEVVLGETEARHRYEHYLETLENPEISYISIKVSGICSQRHPLNFEQSKSLLKERLATLYSKAMQFPVADEDGKIAPKFINLDMEEYKDTKLTYEVFTETLEQDEFKSLCAGIVLQAYLPDSAGYQQRLTEWAQTRVASGGAPIKMRLVKGANLEMETVTSSLKHWANPVYGSKVETDANFLRMIDYGFTPERIKAVKMGIASHNLFSIAYAQEAAVTNGVTKGVSFEMLEGMANNLVRAMNTSDFKIVLYTPVVTNANFLNAVSYLVRRLDENTGAENFIAHSFGLKVDDDSWKYLHRQFLQALKLKETVGQEPHRKQDRGSCLESKVKAEPGTLIPDGNPGASFVGEPDTDFDLPANFSWAQSIVKKWKFSEGDKPLVYPTCIAGETMPLEACKNYIDHAQQDDIEIFKVGMATQKQVEQAITAAEKDLSGWRTISPDERVIILDKVAAKLRENRGDLLGVMAATTGKTLMEGDVEVSEAIDFAQYYPRTARDIHSIDEVRVAGKGVVLVIPPWNFPLAIPVGGVVAGLSAGNNVLLKPATAAAPVACHFVKLMHEAGVPGDALQLILPAERESLNYLTGHAAVKHIIFTGGTSTAYRILENNPRVMLSAETGGKNAIIVTSGADKDLAVSGAVQSAFGNAGQKCSACSLLLLQKDVYDSPQFLAKLKDATESLNVGSPWDLSTEIGPMINSDTENKELIHAIKNMEESESWLVKPEVLDKRRCIMKPGIKLGVKRGSYTFNTELFAPLLAVVRFDTLEEAVEMVNSTGYGLTSGLYSLDEREQTVWKNKIEAGNLYINRGITGAIVQRQPFGGMKESAFGSGAKAGGPNYVTCFMKVVKEEAIASCTAPDQLNLSAELASAIAKLENTPYVVAAVESYIKAIESIFSLSVDVSNIIGEDNHLRYIPAMDMAVRINDNDPLDAALMIAAALELTGTAATVSVSDKHSQKELLAKVFTDAKIESLSAFCSYVDRFRRLRLCGSAVPTDLYESAAKKGVYLADAKPLQCGRLELLNYLQEQSITTVYHRYGNLGDRALNRLTG